MLEVIFRCPYFRSKNDEGLKRNVLHDAHVANSTFRETGYNFVVLYGYNKQRALLKSLVFGVQN